MLEDVSTYLASYIWHVTVPATAVELVKGLSRRRHDVYLRGEVVGVSIYIGHGVGGAALTLATGAAMTQLDLKPPLFRDYD